MVSGIYEPADFISPRTLLTLVLHADQPKSTQTGREENYPANSFKVALLYLDNDHDTGSTVWVGLYVHRRNIDIQHLLNMVENLEDPCIETSRSEALAFQGTFYGFVRHPGRDLNLRNMYILSPHKMHYAVVRADVMYPELSLLGNVVFNDLFWHFFILSGTGGRSHHIYVCMWTVPTWPSGPRQFVGHPSVLERDGDMLTIQSGYCRFAVIHSWKLHKMKSVYKLS